MQTRSYEPPPGRITSGAMLTETGKPAEEAGPKSILKWIWSFFTG